MENLSFLISSISKMQKEKQELTDKNRGLTQIWSHISAAVHVTPILPIQVEKRVIIQHELLFSSQGFPSAFIYQG